MTALSLNLWIKKRGLVCREALIGPLLACGNDPFPVYALQAATLVIDAEFLDRASASIIPVSGIILDGLRKGIKIEVSMKLPRINSQNLPVSEA